MIQYIEFPFGLIAGALIVISNLVYINNTYRKKVTPSILSWIGWTALMGTSVLSQVVSIGWEWSLTSITLSTFGCTAISIIAISLNNFSLKKKDWIFLIFGLTCIILYITSKNPWYTTIFAIIADFILGIPTLIKAYKDPLSEKSMAWNLGLVSWTLSLIICINHDLIYALFPIYLFIFSGTIIFLTNRVKQTDIKSGSNETFSSVSQM